MNGISPSRQLHHLDAAQDIADYLCAVPGAAQGVVFVGVGIGLHRTGAGKIRFYPWVEGSGAWPDEAHDVAALILRNAGRYDIYCVPNVMAGPARAKWTSVAPTEIHADVDGGLDLGLVRSIPGACAVGSGTPGHGHVYALLARAVKHHQHEQLCRALMAHLRATDAKVSDNDMLRVPGTYNFKPRADDPKADPLPVSWLIRPNGIRADPEELAALLGVVLTDEPPKPVPKAKTNGAGATVPLPVVPFDLAGHPWVRRALGRVTGDRSEDTMAVVGACARAGLTEASARWAVLQRQDLAHRLLSRTDDDVARCFGRASADLKGQP
jgi:hypothetical protein